MMMAVTRSAAIFHCQIALKMSSSVRECLVEWADQVVDASYNDSDVMVIMIVAIGLMKKTALRNQSVARQMSSSVMTVDAFHFDGVAIRNKTAIQVKMKRIAVTLEYQIEIA